MNIRATTNRIKFLALLFTVLFVILGFSSAPVQAAVSSSVSVPSWAEEYATWDDDATTTDDDGNVVFKDGTSTGDARTLNSNTKITFQNTPGAVLPSTGGSGTMLFVIIGSCLVILSAALFLMRRRVAGRAVCPAYPSSHVGNDVRSTRSDTGNRGTIIIAALVIAVLAVITGTFISVYAAENTTTQTGDLIIAKEVDGTTGTDQYFPISVTLTGTDGTHTVDLSGAESSVTVGGTTQTNPSSVTISSGTATVIFYIKHNQSVTIKSLPKGTTYTASETNNDGFSTKYKVEATKVETVTLTVNTYFTGLEAPNNQIGGTQTYTAPKGTGVDLYDYSYEKNNPGYTELVSSSYWKSNTNSLWSGGTNTEQHPEVTLNEDTSVDEYVDAGYENIVIFDRQTEITEDDNQTYEHMPWEAYNLGINYAQKDGSTIVTYPDEEWEKQNNPKRSNYNFIGWNTKKDGTGTYVTNPFTDILNSEHSSLGDTADAYLTELKRRYDALSNTTLYKEASVPTAEEWNKFSAYYYANRTEKLKDYRFKHIVYAIWKPKTEFTTTVYNRIQARYLTENNITADSSWTFETHKLEDKKAGDTITMDSTVLTALNGFEVFRIRNSNSEGSLSFTTPIENSTYTQGASDDTITAYYRPIDYKITYNLAGGTNPEESQETYNILSGYTLPTPTKEGYTFEGWLDSDGKPLSATSVVYDNSSLTEDNIVEILGSRQIPGNLTITAKWTITNPVKVKVSGYSGTDENDFSSFTNFYPATECQVASGTSMLNDALFTEMTGEAIPQGFSLAGVSSKAIYGDDAIYTDKVWTIFSTETWTNSSGESDIPEIKFYFAPDVGSVTMHFTNYGKQSVTVRKTDTVTFSTNWFKAHGMVFEEGDYVYKVTWHPSAGGRIVFDSGTRYASSGYYSKPQTLAASGLTDEDKWTMRTSQWQDIGQAKPNQFWDEEEDDTTEESKGSVTFDPNWWNEDDQGLSTTSSNSLTTEPEDEQEPVTTDEGDNTSSITDVEND